MSAVVATDSGRKNAQHLYAILGSLSSIKNEKTSEFTAVSLSFRVKYVT